MAPGAAGGDDIVVEATPSLRIRGNGARVQVEGSVAAQMLSFTRNSQDDTISPIVDIVGRVAAVESVFFVEGQARTTRSYVDPFAARADSTATDNTSTSTQYRVSLYIEMQPAAGLHLRARSDNTKITNSGLVGAASLEPADSSLGHHTASLELEPRPFGWRIEVDSTRTQYDDEAFRPKQDIARLLVNVAVDETLTVGLRGGAERNNFQLLDERRSIYGGQLQWRPTARTLLSADVERRFFGKGWRLTFDHRMQQLAWSVRASRDIETLPQSLLQLPATDNVAAMLDAILTSRVPDPVDRAKQVQDLIASQGLPSSLPSAINIIASRLSLANGVSGTATLTGSRNSIALTIYQSRIRDLFDSGPLSTGTASGNNRQRGASVAMAHRLTPTAAMGLVLDASRIEGLPGDVATTGRTTQGGLRADLRFQVGMKTHTDFGVRYRKLVSDVAVNGEEAQVFVGLDHVF